jgi:hypothetical protein
VLPDLGRLTHAAGEEKRRSLPLVGGKRGGPVLRCPGRDALLSRDLPLRQRELPLGLREVPGRHRQILRGLRGPRCHCGTSRGHSRISRGHPRKSRDPSRGSRDEPLEGLEGAGGDGSLPLSVRGASTIEPDDARHGRRDRPPSVVTGGSSDGDSERVVHALAGPATKPSRDIEIFRRSLDTSTSLTRAAC